MVLFDAAAYLPLQRRSSSPGGARRRREHGYAIGKEVARRTDGQVHLRAATLYTVIKRLLEDGLIEESAARRDPALDDERRRITVERMRNKVAAAEANRLEETVRQARAKLKLRKA